ncbi:MAG: hypothetical protein CME06_17435 [Gemmatimonadetes bacterium]|nr:hypothetical protein [Gemmatimonadota bacterium]
MVLSDVLISYSRRDATFVKKLSSKLHDRGLEVWIDWEDIPYSSNWWNEIAQAIEGASAFVCVLSDEYFGSQTCGAELSLAEESNKRIVPVQYKEFDHSLNSSNAVAITNWLRFTQDREPAESLDDLIDTLNADLAWRRFHSRLQVRASEWVNKNHNGSYILFGEDLDEANENLKREHEHTPRLTTVQINYIMASRAGAKELVRKQLRGFYWATLAYSMAQIGVIYLWDFNSMSETAMIKMSWVWLPGSSFALGGLTAGRYRIRNAFIVMVLAMLLFAVFYATMWQSL